MGMDRTRWYVNETTAWVASDDPTHVGTQWNVGVPYDDDGTTYSPVPFYGFADYPSG